MEHLGFESVGRRFESCRARQRKTKGLQNSSVSLFYVLKIYSGCHKSVPIERHVIPDGAKRRSGIHDRIETTFILYRNVILTFTIKLNRWSSSAVDRYPFQDSRHPFPAHCIDWIFPAILIQPCVPLWWFPWHAAAFLFQNISSRQESFPYPEAGC